ncbi:glycosyltransferase [Rubritalea profundi]|uniref:Glycosyltransferase 2-like domain-containing protein n=1 Tax=Rubritalea profundi TaxID=1658618 RepID=A0A2S7U5Y7_9BACT|nr:glycosyltransferase [Rubritalea profundi]PQJ29851.1 hypothetical protein BSZ32_16085 [Rubritalea profundi]
MLQPRNIAWLSCILLLCLLACLYGQVTTSFDSAGSSRTMLTIGMGILGLASVLLFPKFTTTRATLLAILIPAIIVRVLVAQAAPSDDIHRYLWEGKLLAAGEDPYIALADNPIRQPYHDAHWELMNHRDQPTAYPPIAIFAFSLINKLGYSSTSYKLVFSLLDMILIACFLALLRQLGKPLKWAAFYSLSPIAFLAFSAEAHFDILMVLCLVAGILALNKKHYMLAGTALAFAIHFKLMVAVAIPFLLWRSPLKMWLAFGLAFVIPLIPFIDQVESMLAAVVHFGSIGSFNGPVYQVLQLLPTDISGVYNQRILVNGLTATFYTLVWFSIAYQFYRRRLTGLSAAVSALTALVLLSPIIHFWYLAWLLPFAALSPRASWLSLSVSFGLYFLVWQQLELNGYWAMPVYARWLFWLPFIALSLWEVLGRKRILNTSVRKLTTKELTDISIVIPTKNSGKGLLDALKSIQQQSHSASEIIIVDAQSTDDSLTAASGCRIIQSPAGRGLQIKTGVESANSDWVIILHADAQLPHNALQLLSKNIAANPAMVGGCLGQRFDSSGAGLLLIEVLNEFRAFFGRTSFGDQAQFLHRPTALKYSCLTDQPLMEDVELSDRLRPLGDVCYLGNEVTVSAEKWSKHPFWQRFRLIVRYFFLYRLMLWKPREQRKLLAEKLVTEYYPPTNS